MKAFILRREWSIAAYSVLGAELISGLFFGWRGLLGMFVGIAATWFNAWALWRVILVLGDTVRDTGKTKGGTTVIVLAFLLKLPILIVLGMLTRMIGGAALPCFVAGLGMVYFGLVGWASAHT